MIILGENLLVFNVQLCLTFKKVCYFDGEKKSNYAPKHKI